MHKPLRVLHLEDDPDYSDLVRTMLVTEGIEANVRHVTDRDDFEAALAREEFDIILADFSLPSFNGLQALQTARAQSPQTPFLLVSGTIGEQAAIESLRAGATDYVLKQWPERLAPTVRRAVEEAEERARRRHVETELIRRERYFRTLTENSLDILTILNHEGIFQYNSPSLTRVLGYDPRDLIGQNLFAQVHPDDLPGVMRSFQQALQNPESTVSHEFRFRRRDGSWVSLEAVGQNRLGDPDIAAMVLNMRDITERKRLEEQVRQAQKMEAIGQLAGGVAHDFNNILTVIHGHASLLMAGGAQSLAVTRSAEQIVQAAERAAGLTRQLLAFSRRQIIQPRRLDLNEVVGNMTKMLGRILGEDISLQLNYWPRASLVNADAGMMEQVLLNLAVNSRDAMPKGGQLRIRILVVDVDARHVGQFPDARAGRFVCLATEDNGSGIPPQILERIFEPFFTTKEVGKGTGLGLATVYGIVKQHQGWVEVETEIGKGTIFRVYLPSAGEAVEKGREKPVEIAVRGGSETILVVEDEPSVRELVCSVLRGYGYRVLSAQAGPEAVEIWRQEKDRIDLMLTDLVMPDRVNGWELAESLWADRPELKVIFTSGYGADVAGKEFVMARGSNYLQKPYQPHTLALAVRTCLDANQTTPGT